MSFSLLLFISADTESALIDGFQRLPHSDLIPVAVAEDTILDDFSLLSRRPDGEVRLRVPENSQNDKSNHTLRPVLQ